MMFEYRPVPKKPFKGGKKKQEVYKGRTIPTKKQRGSVSKTTAKRVFEIHGEYCVICGSNLVELHHIKPKGFSNGGRGVWRNIAPLCPEHHRGNTGVHNDKRLMQKLQYEQEKRYGKYYYMDKFDLFKLGLIPNTEDAEFEKFMLRMEKSDG